MPSNIPVAVAKGQMTEPRRADLSVRKTKGNSSQVRSVKGMVYMYVAERLTVHARVALGVQLSKL
mgnify:CR=1 FL=1